MNDQQAQAVCEALKQARENALEEQDRWRERINRMVANGSMDVTGRLVELGWEGISKLMEGEHSPATHQERQRIRKLSWEEEPFEVKLQQIEDDNIRFHVHMLSEVVEQLHRIRASARFLELLAAHPKCEAAKHTFDWWEMHSVYKQLAREAVDDGNEEEAKLLSQFAAATAGVYDILLDQSPDDLSLASVVEMMRAE